VGNVDTHDIEPELEQRQGNRAGADADFEHLCSRRNLSPDDRCESPAALEPAWREVVSDVVRRATLTLPPEGYMHSGGRQGRHTEHLGHLLAEMQILARSHAGAKW